MTRDDLENRIIEAARKVHDSTCSCDPKYIRSCPKMAQAILEVDLGDQ